jgi:hypothetical protein
MDQMTQVLRCHLIKQARLVFQISFDKIRLKYKMNTDCCAGY